MRKADEERRHHGRHRGAAATRSALSPVAPASTSPTAASSKTAPVATTIGRYIARFRYEQPLPREARSSVPREDFWWKSSGGEATASDWKTWRLRQRSPREDGGLEGDGGGDVLSSLEMASIGSANSVKSGYERYIPDLHGRNDEDQQRVAQSPVAVARDRQSPPVAGVRSSDSDDGGGGGGALLVLSSASWCSLPSDLEPPSSSHESAPRDLPTPPSRASRATPQHSGHSDVHRHSETVAVALGVQSDGDDGEEEDEASKVEDAKLVIERVRKRLGWSSSDDDSDALSYRKYDAPPSMSLGSPMMMVQWGQRRPLSDYPLVLPLSSSPALSARLSGEDDEMLSGTMRVSGDSHEPILQVKSPQLALSEPSSENQCQAHDRTHLDTGALVPSSGDAKVNIGNGSELDQLIAGLRLQASVNGDAAKIALQQLDGHVQIEPFSPGHDTRGAAASAGADCAEEFISGEEVLEVHDDKDAKIPDSDALTPGDHQTVASFAPLESVASPVIPVWRRGSSSSVSSSSATSASFPPQALALSPPPPSSASAPRSSCQSSLSSVTAETAKTLDGLVSLVVQSWSSDFFFDAEDDGINQDGTRETSESAERRPAAAADGDDVREDEATDDHVGLGSRIQSASGSIAEERDARSQQTKEESSSENEPRLLSSLPMESNAPLPAAEEDENVNSVGMVDPDATTDKSLDSEKEDESAENEDDEIVQLLLSRIALYEEALRRLEAEGRRTTA